MSFRLTVPAERDIDRILEETLERFGPRQLRAYAAIIDRGLSLVGENPNRAGALRRDEIAAGVRLFHLDHAARRHGAAAHCLYYKTAAGDPNHAIILRVLHQRMEPRHRLMAAIDLDAQDGRPLDG